MTVPAVWRTRPLPVLSTLLEGASGGERSRRFEDPGFDASRNPGEITPQVRRWMRETLGDLLDDRELLDRALGSHLTSGALPPCCGESAPVDGAALEVLLQEGGRLARAEPQRLAYLEARGGETILFAAGEPIELEPRISFAAPLLCRTRRLDHASIGAHLGDPSFAELVGRLLAQGLLVPEGASTP